MEHRAANLHKLLEEEDADFLRQFSELSDHQVQSKIFDEWRRDSRPWARQQLFKWAERVLACPGHEASFRSLIRHAEAVSDHGLMACLMVELDRSVRRSRVVSRQSVNGAVRSERLAARPDRLSPGGPVVPHRRLFTQTTRAYFRRRVWRYFRRLSRTEPVNYVAAMEQALIRYRDIDFSTGENVIDNWSLMHVCFARSPVLAFGPTHVGLASEQSLSDLRAAPWMPEVWQTVAAGEALLRLAADAGSCLVRRWAIELVRHRPLDRLCNAAAETILRLTRHTDPAVLELAGQLLRVTQSGTEWTPEQQIDCLRFSAPDLLADVGEFFVQTADPVAFAASQLITLTQQADADVCHAAFQVLRRCHQAKPLTYDELSQLADCSCRALAGEIATWAIRNMSTQGVRPLIPFLVAAVPETRRAAMESLAGVPVRLTEFPEIALTLSGSIHRDVRLWLMRVLRSEQGECGSASQSASMIRRIALSHRFSSRDRAWAMEQVPGVLADDPAQAETLLPILAAGFQSSCDTDRQAALSAAAVLRSHLPELGELIDRQLRDLCPQFAQGTSGED